MIPRHRARPATAPVLVLWAIAAVSGGAAAAAAQAATVDALVATVGARLILLSDVRLARDLGRPAGDSDERVLDALVSRSLMVAEVERFQQPDPPVAAVDSVLDTLRAGFGAEGWTALLRRHGVDAAYIRAYVRDDLRLETYLRQRFGTLAEPGDEEVAAALAARPSDRPEARPAPDPAGAAFRQELAASRFAALVDQWVAELRARGEVSVRGIPAGAAAPAGRD